MKYSFYFVLWIVIYLLIDICKIPALQEFSFIEALLAVWIISVIITKLTKNQYSYIKYREVTSFFELIYTNDYKRYVSMFRRQLIFNAASFAYYLLVILFFLIIRENLLITAIFAFLGYYSTKEMHKSYLKYKEVRKSGTFELNEEGTELFNRYKEGRDSGLKANQMYPAATWKDKLLRCCNFVFSIGSIILGILTITTFLPGLIPLGTDALAALILVAYGGLAFIYGIYDLSTTISGYNMNLN